MSTELVQVLQEFGLAEEKKNVVSGLLQPFFAKAEEWKVQVDSIVVTDPSQTDKMALAKTGRLQLKNFRLEAEKLVKNQREIVKTRMADDVLEDKLWLRSGQIMEAVFKNLETKLEEKEKFAERWEAEQEETRRQERVSILAQYDVVEMPGLGKMSEDQFQTYLAGLKAQHEAKMKLEAEQKEAERIQQLHNERYSRISRYIDFIPNVDEIKWGEITEAVFIEIGTKAKADKDAHDKEQARIKAENERLQKEKEETEEVSERVQKLQNERYFALSEYRFFMPEFNWLSLGKMSEVEYLEILSKAQNEQNKSRERGVNAYKFLIENGFELSKEEDGVIHSNKDLNIFIGKGLYWDFESDEKLSEFKEYILKNTEQFKEKQKAIDEANALKQAEQARINAIAKEEADRLAEAERIASQGESKRIMQWIESFELPPIPGGGYTAKGQARVQEINAKFEAFKIWAKSTK
jgi:hypothetical protein